MTQMNASNLAAPSATLQSRSNQIFEERKYAVWRQTDRLFAGLLVFQYFAGLAAAAWISPRAWQGLSSQIHPHVWSAAFLGGLLISLPVYLAIYFPGQTVTRHTIAASQMLYAALLIHLSGGRIETHFHIFGSLAFLAFYRDWPVLITATVVVAIDHVIRSLFWPQSVFGVLTSSPWRAFEHAGWVIFEDLFLLWSCYASTKEMHDIARQQAVLESTNEYVEAQVQSRTAELSVSQRELRQQARLVAFAADIGRALTRGDALDATLDLCAMAMVKHLDAFFAQLWVLNEGDQILEVKASAGLDMRQENFDGKEALGHFTIGLIAQEKKPHSTNAVPEDPRIGDKDWARREGIVSFAGHPLIVQNRLVGVMAMFSREKLSNDTLEALASVANNTAIGIERFHSEAKLKLALDAAEQANVAKSQFLANMSHELRTPMNAIIGYSEMLAEEFEEDGQQHFLPDVRKIHTAGKHLLGLINDILDLSKIEAGKMDVFAEEFPLAGFLEDIVATVRPLMEQKQNQLKVRAANELGSANSDQTKVRQILFNLLSNAAKFTEHGEITLEANRVDRNGQDWLELSVHDSGIGMTQEQKEKIFQAFTQAEASTTRRFGGTGLGLTISKRFCELLGGHLTVESVPGVGSCFTASFPATYISDIACEPSNEALSRDCTAQKGLSAPQNEVLVVDDDADARDLMSRFLNKEGYVVATASSGSEALEFLRHRRPIAITLDVMMPGMDGWAVLQALKDDPSLTDIPVVMISMVDNATMGYALGVVDYLCKPPDRNRLGEILQRYRVDTKPFDILIVDDDANNRQMLVRLVDKTDCTIREAQNGVEALACIAERKPDLVMLDLMMPEMDGFQVVAELTRQGLIGQIPVIVLTAKDITQEDRARLNVQQIHNKAGLSRDDLLHEIKGYLERNCSKTQGGKS